MAADPNLANLRTQLRSLTTGPGADLTDETLDAYLRANRVYIYKELLRTPDGRLFQSVSDSYDLAYILANSDETEPTPDTTDELAGQWGFTDTRSAVLYLTGYSYDVNAAAADAWDALATGVVERFDYEKDGGKYSASQQAKAYADRATLYRNRARSVSHEVFRDYR